MNCGLGSDSSLDSFAGVIIADYVMLIWGFSLIWKNGITKNTWVFLTFFDFFLYFDLENWREEIFWCLQWLQPLLTLTFSLTLWCATVLLWQLKYLGFSAVGQRPKCPCNWDLGKRKGNDQWSSDTWTRTKDF